MKTKNRGILLASIAVCTMFSLPQARAEGQDPAQQAGIQLYKEGKYGPAMAKLEEAAKKVPNNVMTRYYMALASHASNQVARATQEYQWVIKNTRNDNLRTMAQKGLDSMSKYGSAHGGGGGAAPVAAAAPSGDESKAEKPAPGKPAKAQAAGPLKVKKVIEFSTSWCHFCKAFEPAFEATKSKYAGKVQFETLDGDDPANADLKSKYNVSAYPTLVYLDAKGNVLKNESGAPSSADAFAEEIESIK